MRFIFIDGQGGRSQFERLTLADLVARIVTAHRSGEGWDIRVKTSGQGYRHATAAEAAKVVAAVTTELEAT